MARKALRRGAAPRRRRCRRQRRQRRRHRRRVTSVPPKRVTHVLGNFLLRAENKEEVEERKNLIG